MVSATQLLDAIKNNNSYLREWTRDYNEMNNRLYRTLWWTEEKIHGKRLTYQGNLISEKQHNEDFRFKVQDSWFYKEAYEFNRMHWNQSQIVRNEFYRTIGLLPKEEQEQVIKHKLEIAEYKDWSVDPRTVRVTKDKFEQPGVTTINALPSANEKNTSAMDYQTKVMNSTFKIEDPHMDFMNDYYTRIATDYKNVVSIDEEDNDEETKWYFDIDISRLIDSYIEE